MRADYEEAEGITTPSKEQVPPSQAETPVAVQLPVSGGYSILSDEDYSTIRTRNSLHSVCNVSLWKGLFLINKSIDIQTLENVNLLKIVNRN